MGWLFPRLSLSLLLASAPALAGLVEGCVTDGQRGLEGVRVYPDRLVRVRPPNYPPIAVTDAEGLFRLEISETDQVLAVEKSGWQRDLVPLAEVNVPVVLKSATHHRVEKVLVVRLDFPDEACRLDDDQLRQILFHRQPGMASAANYFYEISKGSLELEEGAILHLADSIHPAPRTDEHRGALTRWVLDQLRGQDLRGFDRVDNRTGAPQPDGKPDHLWVIPPGPPRTLTFNPAHLSPICLMEPLPWKKSVQWPVVFFSEDAPLGNIVHEALHSMGEHRVDDLYLDCNHPMTAGAWDVMDTGMYRGWDRSHPEEGPWQQDTGYSPSQPTGWVRAELWYYGLFDRTAPVQRVEKGSWTGWMDPLERAARNLPQRLRVNDPRKKGCFWEFNVRRPWGFDRGRAGTRWGPGFEGLVVARVDPSRLSRDQGRGPMQVLDAHPGTKEPQPPRYPCGRWELDDAAYNKGPGENPRGTDGPLSWEVLAVDNSGRMKVRVRLGSR